MSIDNSIVGLGVALLLWGQSALGINNAQVALDISAQSVARVALYYDGKPLSDNQLDFPLPVDSGNGKFEQTSSYFWLVGNVDRAEIVFAENNFILPEKSNPYATIELRGNFIFNGVERSAKQKLTMPVLKDITRRRNDNGARVHFSSEYPASHYAQGRYANTFTLLITPIV